MGSSACKSAAIKDVNMFAMLMKIVQAPDIRVSPNDITQLYNRPILPWNKIEKHDY